MKTLLSWSLLLGIRIAVLLRYAPELLRYAPEFSPSTSEPQDPMVDLCENLTPNHKTVWSPEGRQYTFVNVLADTCGWYVVMDPRNATIVWTTGHSDMPKSTLESLKLGDGQIWNQLHDAWMMTDKAKLHRLLASVNHAHYQPETYLLSDPDECVSFFKAADAAPQTVWVAKEPTNSQGDGIVVNPDINVLKEMWLEDPKASNDQYKCKSDDNDEDIIAQRYLLNPLLLEGKKMEIRSYWVIASVEPFIVLYRDGTVRLTTRNYKPDEWDDPLIHITNTKQQKKADPNYATTEKQRKWTVHQLADYLKQENKISEDSEIWLDGLREMLKERIAVSALAAHPQLLKLKKRRGWDGRFELFGMDVILDDNLQPWLTELQDGPGLSMDPGIKQHVILNMIKELVNVVLEIDQSLRYGKNLSYPLRSLGEWHQIDLKKYQHLIPKDFVK